MSTKTRAAVALAVTVAAAALELVAPTPAGALAPAVAQVQTTSASNSFSPKTQVTYCPAGTSILGGGYQIIGGKGQVGTLEARPVYDGALAPAFKNSFRVTAAESKDGTAASWSVQVLAYCTPTTATQIVSAESPLDSDPMKTSPPAVCPEGKKVVGAGGYVSGMSQTSLMDAQVSLQSYSPSADLQTVQARGTEPGGILDDVYAGTWKVVAVASCAQPYYADGLTRVRSTRSSPLGLWDYVQALMACPAGQRLISASADMVDDGAGAYLTSARNQHPVPVHAHVGAMATRISGTPSVVLTVYGICVNT